MPTDRISRARLAFAVLMGLIVFLLGSLYQGVKQRDRRIAQLVAVNETVVDKLADVLAHTIAAEKAALEAGQTPAVRVEDILDQVKGVDQALIDQALQKAYNQVARGPTGPTGRAGPTGPQGPPGTSTPAASTTTTTAAATSTTARPPPSSSTTSSSSTTTTTTTAPPCTVRLLGVCLVK